MELWYRIKLILTSFVNIKRRGRFIRYEFPIILTLLALLFKTYFFSTLGASSAFLLSTSIVILSAAFGGLGPGLLATTLTAIGNYYFFLRLNHTPAAHTGDLFLTFLFILEGTVISILSEARYEIEAQKDEFIAFAAHELKNPLSSIKGYVELASKKFHRPESKAHYYIAEINEQIERILELINDLLDVTKIEIGKFTYQDEYFGIDDLVKEVVEHQRIIHKTRYIKLQGSSKKIVYGDKYRITQVLVNLISNALKYSAKSQEVKIKIKGSKGLVTLSVQDFGIGIAREDLKKAFSRFYRSLSATRRTAEGLGLGLFICSQIVKHHQGEIWAISKKGQGSTFYLQLPAK